MNSASKKKVLVLVEGIKADVYVMKKLFSIYSELDIKYEIVPYCTNIYVLYQDFFSGKDMQDNLDILQVLKSREPNPEKKRLFDEKYTDILLIFDLDPQDNRFTEEKIRQMQAYFCESSDMGKLYLNYPMIEAFFHMPSILDPDFKNRIVTMEELKKNTYKQRVHHESYGHDYRKFIRTRADFNYVILENIQKAFMIIGDDKWINQWHEINLSDILEKQLHLLLKEEYLHVLCTCVMYIYDYNTQLLLQS